MRVRYWSFIVALTLSVAAFNQGTAQAHPQAGTKPVQTGRQTDSASALNRSHLLKIALPVILQPAADAQLDLQEIAVKWVNFTPALCFSVSLFDLNADKIIFDKQTVYAPSFVIPAGALKYGHRYRLLISALSFSGTETWSHLSFKINVLPALNGLARRMAQYEAVVWDNCLPELLAARDKLVTRLKSKGWTIYFTSAYRPYQLQEHYYLILETLKDPDLDEEDRIYLRNKKKWHGLGVLAAPPSAEAPHIRGAAFDAMVVDNKGRALNGLSFMHPALLSLMQEVGFKVPPPEDYVHFEIDGTDKSFLKN